MALDLRQERRSRDLSLAEVARRSGLAASNLSRAERPDTDPRLSTVERALAGMGLRLTVEPIPTLSLDDMRSRADAAQRRLADAGIGDRDLEQRLAWKEARGIDTTVERRLLGRV